MAQKQFLRQISTSDSQFRCRFQFQRCETFEKKGNQENVTPTSSNLSFLHVLSRREIRFRNLVLFKKNASF